MECKTFPDRKRVVRQAVVDKEMSNSMRNAVKVQQTARFSPWIAITDLVDGAARVPLWVAFASDEIQQRYRRSKLGLTWIVFSYLIFVGTISLFFGSFSDLNHQKFTLYVAVNFAIFMFLLANLTDGCAVFRTAASWIKSAPLPHSIHLFKSVSRSVFIFAINFAIAIALLFLYGHKLTWVALEAIPAFALILFNSIFIQMILGYISARYPDIEHLMMSITRVLFFTTPVLWVRDEHSAPGLRNTVAEFNPLTHALEIFSSPILGQHGDPRSWVIMLWLSLAVFVIGIFVAGACHRRLPYWL